MNNFNPGEAIYWRGKAGTFIRLITPKRNPYAAPEKGIVQIAGNKGTSQIRLTELKLA